MSITNIVFWGAFLPVVLLLYYGAGRTVKLQNVILTMAGLFFYGTFGVRYVLLLAGCVLLTYGGGLLGSRAQKSARAGSGRLIWGSALILNLLVLYIFKYLAFTASVINKIFVIGHVQIVLTPPAILLPVGLSFYIFQSSSYLADLLLGKIEAEEDLTAYAAFVTCFPNLTAGPILKAREYLPVFKERRVCRYEVLQESLYIFLWGAFLKLMIADRVAQFTDPVMNSFHEYRGLILILAAFAYSLQIYADFAGYSFMAVALCRALGLPAPENFRQPYFAVSIVDFWRRWHISLTSWLREYIYIPLGGNRKGKIRRYLNVVIVFLVSGLWHGAALHYVVWGLYHAMLQVLEMLTGAGRRAVSSKGAGRWARRVWTFLLVTVGWLFFRIPGVRGTLSYMRLMLRPGGESLAFSLNQAGVTAVEAAILAAALLIMIIAEIMREHGRSTVNTILVRRGIVRYLIFAGLFLSLIVFGIYGETYSAGNFIYAGF